MNGSPSAVRPAFLPFSSAQCNPLCCQETASNGDDKGYQTHTVFEAVIFVVQVDVQNLKKDVGKYT